MSSEKKIQTEIFKALGGRLDVRLFRNNVGTGFQGKATTITRPGPVCLEQGDVVIRNPRRVAFGLHKGSGDLIGWQEVTITPDMVGQKVARVLSVEVKAPRGKTGPQQENWARVVNGSGGVAGVARSAAEALKLIEEG